MSARILGFPALATAEFDRGQIVSLDDGRIGHVDHRVFSITPDGQTFVNAYAITLVGGRGRIEVAPRRVKPCAKIQAAPIPKGAA